MLLSVSIAASGAGMDYGNLSNISLNSDAYQGRCFSQDSQGFIWIGTDKGLCRYDGYNIHNHFRNGAIGNVRIHSMALYNEDFLLLGTEKGLLTYNILRDEYSAPETGLSCIIRSMFIDGDTVILGTVQGIYSFYISHGHDGTAPVLTSQSRALDGKDIYFVTRVKERYIAGGYIGMFSLSKDFKEVGKILVNGQTPNVNAIVADEESNCIWFCHRGLTRYHIPSGEATRTAFIWPAKTMARDYDGNFIIGTDFGLFCVDSETGSTRRYHHDSNRRHSLSNDIVLNIFRDSKDNIWIGTDYGVSVALKDKEYKHLELNDITVEGKGNLLFHIGKDNDGSLWLGGNNGLIKYNPDGSEESKWYSSGSIEPLLRLPHNRIRSICKDEEGRLWAGTDGGLLSYNRDTGRFNHRTVLSPDGDMAFEWIYQVVEDNEGYLWMTTYKDGVIKIDPRETDGMGTFLYISRITAADGLRSNYIGGIAYNSMSHSLYVLANQGGLDRIDCKTGTVSHVQLDGYSPEEYPMAVSNGLDSHIWVGMSDGVVMLDTVNGEQKKVSFKGPEKLSITCMAIVEGELWVCTDNGIRIISRDGKTTNEFNIENKTFFSIFHSDTDRKVYLGEADGFVIADEKIAKHPVTNDDLLISRVLVNGKEYITPRGNFGRFSKRLMLKSIENNINIEFSDLSFSNSGFRVIAYSIRYKKKENGFLLSGSNEISLPALRPGKYVIRYHYRPQDDSQTQNEKSIEIRIRQPLFLSALAKSLYLLLFSVAMLFIYQQNRMKRKIEEERKEKEVIIRQAEEKMLFYEDISHEFKTPLSMILAPVSQMMSEDRTPKDRKNLELVQQHALKLNQLIHRAIEFGRSSNAAEYSIIRTKVELIEFVRTIFLVFEENWKGRGKEFIFTTSLSQLFYSVDAVKLESIVNNLISNACKYTSTNDSIIVSLGFSDNGKNIEMKVSDTGIGIPKEELPYIFQKYFKSSSLSGKTEGSGIGLFLVRHYLHLLGGEVYAESCDGQGTTFTVHLPEEYICNDNANDPAVETDDRSGLPTVVIVEDNEAIAAFIKGLLYDNYRCVIAHNGKTGLTLCRELLPNLIITDLMMPVMDGIRMCTLLKKNPSTQTIPIIVLTAVEDKKYELFSTKLKIDAFITKPFDSNQIVMQVKNLIEKKMELEKKVRMEVIAQPKVIDEYSQDEKLLSKMVAAIESHITDTEFNVGSLSDELGISSKQLYRKCSQMVNMSPVEYIRSVRLKKAALLLEQHQFNISEVMYMVGFNNSSYFSKCFQKEYGKTPLQYRKSFKKETGQK